MGQYSRVNSRATDDGSDLITVSERFGQGLNIDGVDALGAAIPVGRGVECAACSRR